MDSVEQMGGRIDLIPPNNKADIHIAIFLRLP